MPSEFIAPLIFGLAVFIVGVWSKDKLVLTIATVCAGIVAFALAMGTGEKLPMKPDLMANGEIVPLVANIYAALAAFVVGIIWISIRRKGFAAGKVYLGSPKKAGSHKMSWLVLLACVAAFGAVGYDTYMNPPHMTTTVTAKGTEEPEPAPAKPQPEKRAKTQTAGNASQTTRHKRSDLDLRQCLDGASNSDIVKCAN